MPTYVARGSVVINGATFTIKARDKEEALKKARNGDFDEYDIDHGEIIDFEIKTGTVEIR